MIKALNLIKILTRSLYYINDNYTKNKLIAVYKLQSSLFLFIILEVLLRKLDI